MTRLSESDVQAIIELAKEAGQYLGEYSPDRRERFLDVLIDRGKVCDSVDDLAADWLDLRAENEQLEKDAQAAIERLAYVCDTAIDLLGALDKAYGAPAWVQLSPETTEHSWNVLRALVGNTKGFYAKTKVVES